MVEFRRRQLRLFHSVDFATTPLTVDSFAKCAFRWILRSIRRGFPIGNDFALDPIRDRLVRLQRGSLAMVMKQRWATSPLIPVASRHRAGLSYAMSRAVQ